jgi:Dehydrogenases with different specificities (related to short-chain alcohol dehydrogenases)
MNKLVLISGSSRGLGAAMAKSFSESGYEVAINYFNSEKEAKNLSSSLPNLSHVFECDVSNKDHVDRMLSDIKDVFGYNPSVLINNAMTSYVFNGDDRKNAETISWNEIQDHLNVTLKGSLNLIQGLIPHMKNESFGRIINIWNKTSSKSCCSLS